MDKRPPETLKKKLIFKKNIVLPEMSLSVCEEGDVIFGEGERSGVANKEIDSQHELTLFGDITASKGNVEMQKPPQRCHRQRCRRKHGASREVVSLPSIFGSLVVGWQRNVVEVSVKAGLLDVYLSRMLRTGGRICASRRVCKRYIVPRPV